MLRAGLSGDKGLLLIVLLGLGSLGRLGGSGGGGSLGLLLGGSVDDGLLDQGGLAGEGEELRLVSDSVEVAEEVGVGGAVGGVENLRAERVVSGESLGREEEATHELETTGEGGGDEDVGDRDAVSDEEGLVGEGLLEVRGERLDLGLCGLDGDLVVGGAAEKGAEPGSNGGEEVSVGP